MELLSLNRLISAACHTFPAVRYPLNPIHLAGIIVSQNQQNLGFVISSKKSDFVDFQAYVKPSRLLPATQVKDCSGTSLEEVVTNFKAGEFESLYMVNLQTSSSYGSGVTDINAGMLLCLVDKNGDSILQRIPASLGKDHPVQSSDEHSSDTTRFQRSSVDEFTFEGPKLGKLEAVWIGIESGQWRLGGMSLTIITRSRSPSENGIRNRKCVGFRYDFEVQDILLGDGSNISMTEIRPHIVSEFSEDKLALLSQNFSPSTSVANFSTSNEENMKEYADLKFSLLLYDAMLVLAGSSIAALLAGEDAALPFLTGGIGGFLYLLLLQRSVDGLQSPGSVSSSKTGNFDRIFGRLGGGPVWSVALAFAFAVITMKYAGGDGVMAFTPKQLVSGVMGFLVCKIAVVLAAFKPTAISVNEDE